MAQEAQLTPRGQTNVVLFVVGLALWTVVSLSGRPDVGRVDAALFPELAADELVRLQWEYPDGETVSLWLRESEQRVDFPGGQFRARRVAVQRVIDALALAAIRRRSPEKKATGGPGLVIDFVRQSPVRLSIGPEVPEVRGAWVQRSDKEESYLVEAHIVRDLRADWHDLIDPQVFDLSKRPRSVELASADGKLVAWEDGLSSMELSNGLLVRTSEPARRELERLLAKVRLVSYLRPEDVPQGDMSLLVDGTEQVTISDAGPCGEGSVSLRGATVAGCIDGATVEALATKLMDDSWAIDRALFPTELERVRFERGGEHVEVVLSGVDGQPGRAWLKEIEDLVSPSARRVAGKEIASFSIGGDPVVRFYEEGGDLLARRSSEEVALVVGAPARELLKRGPLSLVLSWRDALDLVEIVREDPAGQQRVVRKPDLEWGADRPLLPGVAERIAHHAASLRAEKRVAAEEAADHALTDNAVRFRFRERGDDAMVDMRLRKGRDTESGCLVQLDDRPDVFEIPKDACSAFFGDWFAPIRRSP